MVIGAGAVLLAFAGIAVLYGTVYSLHQDLAGGVLTGKLAVALGPAFSAYIPYFPPAEKFWFMLAAVLGDATGLGAQTLVLVQTCAAVLFSAGLGFVIRKKTKGAGVGFFVISLFFLLVPAVLFKNNFGLREHLVVLGLWPYLVLRAAGPQTADIGIVLRVLLGAWMGFTLLFKYLYSIVVLCVELADAIAQRRMGLLFRPENLISGGIVFVYLLVWLGFDPDQRATISAMQAAISANLMATEDLFRSALGPALLALVFVLIAWRLRANGRLIGLGLAAVIGAIAVAWVQHRWYTHHLFPVLMGFVGWWWLVSGTFARRLHLVAVGALAFVLYQNALSAQVYFVRVAALEAALDQAGQSFAGQRVALLNQHPSPYNQVIVSQGGQRWTPLMNIAYVSAALQPFDTPENQGQLPPPLQLSDPGHQLLHGRMLQLWEDYPPDILIIDRTEKWPTRYLAFDWAQLLSEDARYQAIMQDYTQLFTLRSPVLAFDYYVRAN